MTAKLFCVTVGVGSIFAVNIDITETVADLKKKIKEENPDLIRSDAPLLKVYLARDGNRWLNSNDDNVKALERGEVPDAIRHLMSEPLRMLPARDLNNDAYFGKHFKRAEDDIHVLVELPVAYGTGRQTQDGLWLVQGSISNALTTKGVRCKLYRLAGSYLGYYDPARRNDDRHCALWYEDSTLRVHILFKTEENALRFDNAIREEPVTPGSALNGHDVTTAVIRANRASVDLQRIYFVHYDPQECDSPQDTMSSISLTSSSVTLLDATTDEFKYQRIEHERLFVPYIKAESCHLVSRKQSRNHKREFAKYDRDANNRLALSREMHGYYDGLSSEVPIMNIFSGDVNTTRSVGNRFKVEILIRVLDAQCRDRVFSRLKDGSVQTEDPLVMSTFVYVEDPDTFCTCLRWKFEDNQEQWSSFLSMTPAIN